MYGLCVHKGARFDWVRAVVGWKATFLFLEGQSDA